MGIPKFYRWLSERYPLINQSIASTHVPVIDNLYLDMNGIIHNCTHGNDPNVKLTEEEMILKIFAYIEKLFQIIQPQKLLFAAIDGSAPRAKMNQQRGRRFKAAKAAAEVAAKRAREDPELGAQSEAFDSNCITPGTPFMGRLAGHLKFFFRKKISEDTAWQKPAVIFSGHDVPGEGEHKIMEHIRWAKRSADYAPNQRHCLYGLDADLIMLSLVTHEPHFCLLREVVSFSGGGRGQPAREVLANPKKEDFILFQVGLLREYMELEFTASNLGFPFDVERFIDDFVLFCMLIGNDFLPTLPTLDVNEGALDTIFHLYKQVLPQMGGYLVHDGRLNPRRLEVILAKLADLELETLEQRASDAQWFAEKKGKGGRSTRASELDQADEDAFGAPEAGHPPEKASEPTMMGAEARQMFLSGQGRQGLHMWRDRYYQEKLELDPRDPASIRQAVGAYMAGLNWVMEYYYRGVVSWVWYYPFHYSPMVSDMTDLQDLLPSFERGQPFTPFQQLLAVLPSASHKLLPKPYQQLMLDPSSTIHQFYPLDFALDSEGKRQEWEAVVVLNFVDEKLLRLAESSIDKGRLTHEEQQRNRFGQILCFVFDAESRETEHCLSTLPKRVPGVTNSRSRCRPYAPQLHLPEGEPGFQPVLIRGTMTGKHSPAGFPTMKTLELLAGLRQAGVSALGQASKRESLILTVTGMQAEVAKGTAQQLAKTLMGQKLWIKWPYLQEAIVHEVSDAKGKVGSDLVYKPWASEGTEQWQREAKSLSDALRTKSGVSIGASNILLGVLPCEGLVRQLDNTVEKQFAKKAVLHPIQVTLKVNLSPDPRLDPERVAQGQAPSFAIGDQAVFVGRAHYGCLATIKRSVLPKVGEDSSGLLTLSLTPAPAAAITAVQTAKRLLSSFQTTYRSSYEISRGLGVTPRCLSLLTGNFHVSLDGKRFNLGLCVKDAQKGLCVPEFAKAQASNQGWQYSPALTQVLQKYKASFPWVFRAIDDSSESRGDLDVAAVLRGYTADQQLAEVTRVQKWLKALPMAKRVLVKTSAEVAPEQAVRMLQSTLPPALSRKQPDIEVSAVSPQLLLAPRSAGSVPSVLCARGTSLGDRVAFLSCSGPARLGARGTVVGVHEEDFEVLFDAPFDGGNDLQGRCHGGCGAVCSAEDLLNLTDCKYVGPSANGKSAGSAANGTASSVSKMPPGLTSPLQAKAGTTAKPHNRQPEGADPPRAATPPASTWIGQRRNLDANMVAAINNFDKEEAESSSRRSAAHQPARKVVDPPHAGSQGSRGFTLGRGRPVSRAISSNGVVPIPAGPTGDSDVARGQLPGAMADALQKTSQEPEEAVNHDHKVHRGMSAAREILRLSQQNLAALDTDSPAEAAALLAGAQPGYQGHRDGGEEQPVQGALTQPSQAQDQAAPLQSTPGSTMLPGSAFLAMLQKGGKARLSERHSNLPGPNGSTHTQAPAVPAARGLPSWFQTAPVQLTQPQPESTQAWELRRPSEQPEIAPRVSQEPGNGVAGSPPNAAAVSGSLRNTAQAPIGSRAEALDKRSFWDSLGLGQQAPSGPSHHYVQSSDVFVPRHRGQGTRQEAQAGAAPEVASHPDSGRQAVQGGQLLTTSERAEVPHLAGQPEQRLHVRDIVPQRQPVAPILRGAGAARTRDALPHAQQPPGMQVSSQRQGLAQPEMPSALQSLPGAPQNPSPKPEQILRKWGQPLPPQAKPASTSYQMQTQASGQAAGPQASSQDPARGQEQARLQRNDNFLKMLKKSSGPNPATSSRLPQNASPAERHPSANSGGLKITQRSVQPGQQLELARDLHRALPDLTTGARQEATAVAEADVAPYRDLLQRDSHLMQQAGSPHRLPQAGTLAPYSTARENAGSQGTSSLEAFWTQLQQQNLRR